MPRATARGRDLAAASAGWCKGRDVRLIFGGRVAAGRHTAAVLQEGDVAEARLVLALVLAAAGIRAVARAVSVGLRRWIGLPLRLGIGLLSFLAAVAPSLVVPVGEAAHRLDHSEIVIRVLPIGLGHDAVTGRGRFARQRLVLVEHLVRIATHPHIRTAAVENLVSIRRSIGVVMLLVMTVAATAATIAAAARPLTIVWSH